jgi:hypothetical protein
LANCRWRGKSHAIFPSAGVMFAIVQEHRAGLFANDRGKGRSFKPAAFEDLDLSVIIAFVKMIESEKKHFTNAVWNKGVDWYTERKLFHFGTTLSSALSEIMKIKHPGTKRGLEGCYGVELTVARQMTGRPMLDADSKRVCPIAPPNPTGICAAPANGDRQRSGPRHLYCANCGKFGKSCHWYKHLACHLVA